MLWFRRSTPPRPAVRTRLRLEALGDRLAPSSFGDDEPLLGGLSGRGETRIAVAPQIVGFVGAETGIGWYEFSGQVVGPAVCGGLTITFGGIPALAGKTATTAADGTFSLAVRVQTDGTDAGTATAQTIADGQSSNVATYYISPTP